MVKQHCASSPQKAGFRNRRKGDDHLTLGKLIARLEQEPPDKVLRHGFTRAHSYRGYYDQLAFEPQDEVPVGDMLAEARRALGTTYTGWKGGNYRMHEYTDCWISKMGCSSKDPLSARVLEYMLADTLPASEKEPTMRSDEIRKQRDEWVSGITDWLSEHQLCFCLSMVAEELAKMNERAEAEKKPIDLNRNIGPGRWIVPATLAEKE